MELATRHRSAITVPRVTFAMRTNRVLTLEAYAI